jgi:AbrB family looped-hinge helix DNA binding protein
MMEHERKVGPKGQVVIPGHFRSALGIKPTAKVFLSLKGDSVIIRPRKSDSRAVIKELLSAVPPSKKIHLTRKNIDKWYDEMMSESVQ